jgi:puromycin-sensitive aminopeptidase
MNPKAYRLPTTVLPRQYDIALDARLGSSEFHGRVAIQLAVAAPTNVIELHARDLQVTNAQLAVQDQTLPGDVQLDADREIAIIQFGQPLPTGPSTLTLDYTGTISQSREGLFESKDGPAALLSSQCEPTGARSILPCFDEPTFKARFAWQITTASGDTVLTNGRLISTTPSADGTAQTWTFAPTRPMSTYLLALVIGDVASTTERVVNGVPLRIWAPRGKEQIGQFALDYTARLLPLYEDYFAVPYHFEKLDQVGVPSFFGGAMENAGLIISDQVILLLDPQSASRQQESTAAMVIAHEFAHMWFGDLVTMRWWDDLWLNEAFASWMSLHALDILSPQYRIWDELQGGVDFALETDGLASSHAIYNPVDTPRGILENIDVITYQKGGAVLRMVHDFLGDEAFRAGMRTYMAEFGEKNATGPDLWRHLQQASHLPVGQVMESWIMQAGHPLVTVGVEGSGTETHLHVSQHRFFASARPPASDQLWLVPLMIRYEDAAGLHETRYLLTETSASVPLNVTGDLLWCYANAGEIGFYRQQLDPTLLQRLLAHLDRLAAPEQKGLLRDQLALVTNGTQPISAYLDAIGALAGGNDQTLVGQIVSNHLQRVESLLETAGDERATAGFRAWVAELFRDKMAALGFQPASGDDADTTQLRAHVLAAMTRYAHDPQALEQARLWEAREAADPAAVDPTLSPVFVGATAQFGDTSTYERFLGVYEQRKQGEYTPQQVEYYAQALGRFQQPELVSRTLALAEAFTFPIITMGGLLGTLIQQPRSQVATWEWLKRNWAMFEERLPMIIPAVVQISGTLPISLRDDVAAFWEEHLHGEYAGPLARAMEQFEQNADFKARNQDDLVAYFSWLAPAEPAPPAVNVASPAPAPAPATVGSAAPIAPIAPAAPMPPTPPVASSGDGSVPGVTASGDAVPASAPSSASAAAPPAAPPTPQSPRGLFGRVRRLFGARG